MNPVVLFEDNHCLAVAKPAPLLTQGVPPGIPTLEAMVKSYLKERYHKAGNVYLGIPHRLDRPVSGVVLFARSTKEGNYYMVPMFFVALPLSYWSMTPGMELDAVTSWVPVANALLLQQRLMAVRPDPFPWQHVPAVVISLTACIAVALWAAVRQFHRESVLFREAEAAGGGWSLFGRKGQKA